MRAGTTTDLVGRVLAGRYRILAPIGAGSGGVVYAGHDVRLNRRVAVKVLHAALADDDVFLRRFRAEAQFAAGLGHPNVMAVYDWGEEDHVPFMVLELLPGGSLRSLLAQGRLLSVSQAAHVGRQVLAALRYAHARGVVHRDIKPGNLLFDEHGNVRVGDFGLAAALAQASWTEPASGVTGTIRYAPPEQAAGTRLDGRADLYSLAVVLVEAVTGDVPQLAETPLGTLAARSRLGIEAPERLGPLRPVVERRGRPRPDDRFADAAEMDTALAAAAVRLPPPEPVPLPGLRVTHDDEPTHTAVPVHLYDQDREARGTGRPRTVQAPRRRAERAPGSRRLVPAVVALVLVAAVAAAAVAFATTSGAARVAVPGLVGRSEADAAVVTQRAGLGLTVRRRVADDPKGVILKQDPARGAFTGRGDDVRVVVSLGPPKVAVPQVKGRPLAEAAQALEQAGFVVTVQRAYDDGVGKDVVIDTDPAGLGRAPRESAVVLVVSDGPKPVPIPSVAGKTFEEAVATLTQARFQVTRRDDFNDTVETGKVIATEPAASSMLQPGAPITVVVSKGPELVAVPNVIGMTVDAARQALIARGLVPVVISGLATDKVFGQDLPPNTMVKKGVQVRIAA